MALNNHKRLSVTRLLAPVALAALLAACSSAPKIPTSVDITLAPSQPIQTYLMRADSSQGSLQNDWLIMALKAADKVGDNAEFELLNQRLARQSLSPMQQAEWLLIRAKRLFNQGYSEQALQTLNFTPTWQLNTSQWLEYHQLRSVLFTQQNDLYKTTRELSFSNQYQSTDKQVITIQQIWDNLNQYTTARINSFLQTEADPQMQSWLKLSKINKELSDNLLQLKSQLQQWLADNPNHPAALYTPQKILDILALEITKPANTALLLPLSGQFAKQARLIRDGFILEMMSDKLRDTNATLTVLDTNAMPVKELEATLIEKNIDSVIGPLLKTNIEKLQQIQANLAYPLPILALNIPNDIQAGDNTCYLSLSPEQEVVQAAKHLAQQGAKYPLILAPQGHLGTRVVEAFEQEWRQHSDNKVAVNLFGNKRQLQRNINKVFGLQESQQHIAQMESLLDRPLESEPRSRRDIDAVYIVASGAELTLIKPFIEVAINPDAAPPKLYSSSRSNSGRHQYEDLSGIIYSDIPLLIHPDASLEAQMKQLWPKDSNAEKRLQALGMDAYRLLDKLPQIKVIPDYQIEGNTGLLTLNENCVVQREISWAKHGATE